MRRRPFESVFLAAVAILWFGGCGSDDTHPPPAPTSPSCEDWNCVQPPSPIAAVAVEQGTGIDGGACDKWRFSMPAGDDAFSSILACGGNKIRCGSDDYRVDGGEPGTTLTCTVSPSGKVRLHGRVSQSNGTHFEVDGDIDASGGPVTISARAASDGGAITLEPTACRVTKVEFLIPGSIWANFDCAPSSDASTCAARGTFVFENCVKDADAG
jgi:hypothetical protein